MTISHLPLLCLLLSLLNSAASQDDATVMQSLKLSLNLTSDVNWSDPDPCKWDAVQCDGRSRVTKIQLNEKGITGTLPHDLGKLSELLVLELFSNNISGPIPDLSGLTLLRKLNLHGQNLKGSISVLQNLTSLIGVDLQGNLFSGPIPDLSGLHFLRFFNVKENQLTGVVPPSFTSLKLLTVVNLTYNFFQGPTPSFDRSVVVDVIANMNSFCLDTPGTPCDPRVESLLSIAESFGYPLKLATSWTGNDPCDRWDGITCSGSDVTMIDFGRFDLTGMISPSFAKLTSLQTIDLSNNNLTGSIPTELTTLPKLRTLDVSNNNITGTVPKFSGSVNVVTTGNANIGKEGPVSHPLVEFLQKMNKDKKI